MNINFLSANSGDSLKPTNDEKCHFDILPNILFQYIFSFFPKESVCKFSLVSKKWNIQSSQNWLWKPWIKTNFPDSYQMFRHSQEVKENKLFWKNLYREGVLRNINIENQNFLNRSIPCKEKALLIKISSGCLFKVFCKEGSSWISVEKMNKETQEILLSDSPGYVLIHNIQIENEIIYAISSSTVWIIDQKNTVYALKLEDSKPKAFNTFDSFAVDEKGLYARASYEGRKVIYSYDLLTKTKKELFEILEDFFSEKSLEQYGNALFIATGKNKIGSFSKITGEELKKYVCDKIQTVEGFKVYKDKLFICAKIANYWKHYVFTVWDLNSDKQKRQIEGFFCCGNFVGMHFFDHRLFCGFTDTGPMTTIVVFDTETLLELARFCTPEPLYSFCVEKGVLAFSTQTKGKNPRFSINKKVLTPDSLGDKNALLIPKFQDLQNPEETHYESLIKKRFPDSYEMFLLSKDFKKNEKTWKNLLQKEKAASVNIETQNFISKSCQYKELVSAIKINSEHIFKAFFTKESSWITVENINEEKLVRKIALCKDHESSMIIHEIKIKEEIIYARSSDKMWIIDQDDTVYSFPLEQLGSFDEHFKSFVLDEKLLYTYGKDRILYAYDLRTKTRALFLDRPSYKQQIELYKETLFIVASCNTIVSINKKTRTEIGKYNCNNTHTIEGFKIYNDKISAIPAEHFSRVE